MRLIGLAIIILVGLALLPFGVGAQRASQIPRIGFLGNGTAPATTPHPSVAAFRQGLRELGWIEGQNVTIEYRWAAGDPTRHRALVTDLVQLKVDVIVLSGPSAIRAAREATSTVPIVFVLLTDPVAAGYVKSFARPGGNLTGMASQFEELITKQLQLLQETLPRLSRITLLQHRDSLLAVLGAAETASRNLGLTARTFRIAEMAECEQVFKTSRRERVDAIHVLPSPVFNAHRRQLIDLAARYRLPAVYEFTDYVQDGGLMSYGPSIADLHRGMASYVDISKHVGRVKSERVLV
jgi:putative tryptophan/tyrosine transport system substrate-binding protein